MNGKCCSKGSCELALKKKLLSRCLRSYLCGTCRFSFLHSLRRWYEWQGTTCELCSLAVENSADPKQVYCSADACALGVCPCSCGSHYLFRLCSAALISSSSLQTITLSIPRHRRNSNMNSEKESFRISVELSEEIEGKELEAKSGNSSPKKSQENPCADEVPAKAAEGTLSRKSSAGSPQHGVPKDATGSSKIQELFSKLKTGTQKKKPKKEQFEAADGADSHCHEDDRRDVGKGEG